MFQKIAASIQLPDWAKRDPRYIRLDLRDRLLDGTFYDHLRYAFYDEKMPGTGETIPIIERRPSAQFRLPRMVSRWCARKLFAGRHRPKLRHADKAVLKGINRLIRQSHFMQTMSDAVLLGSVGSVAITFRIDEPDTDNARAAFNVWRAKYCVPSFDPMGELSQLRINYVTLGAPLRAMKAPGIEAKDDDKQFWWIRDYLPDRVVTYQPEPVADWNPVDGFVGADRERRKLIDWVDPEQTVEHGLGFVPGHWFVNMSGGLAPDGACTWQDAIPNSIELDYTLSQVGRGARYNCAPQPVVIGKMLNSSMTRGPLEYLHIEGGFKDEDGTAIDAGDAKLLEMSGTGVKATLELTDKLRNFALEQIAASRKDPDKMKAPLSGRAMEYLDEDTADLIMDLRGAYGEDGALPLLRKVILAAKVAGDNVVASLSLQWPRLFQPTPDEVFALVQALVLALDPMKKSAPAQPAKPGAEGRPGTPATPATSPGPGDQLITTEEARAYLMLNLDLGIILDEAGEDGDDTDIDDSPSPPAEPTPPVPPPTSIDLTENPEGPQNTPTPGSTAEALGGAGPMNVGPHVTVNA